MRLAFTIFAPAPFLDHFGYDFRVVLQIHIDRNDRTAPGMCKPGRKRCIFSKVARQNNQPNPGVAFHTAPDFRNCRILTTIVYEHKLDGFGHLKKRLLHFR